MDEHLVEELYAPLRADGMLSERIIYAIYREVVVQGDTCLDVGASLGLHTKPLAQLVGGGGRVFAFEAIPFFAQKLSKVAEARGLSQITVVNKAVFRENIELQFNWVKNKHGYSAIELRELAGPLPEIERISIEGITLDSFAEHHDLSRLRFIKMDVEGAEFDALIGARNILSRFRPLVIFEGAGQKTAELYHYTMESFFSFFEQIEYQIFDIFMQPFDRRGYEGRRYAWNFIAVPIGADSGEIVAGAGSDNLKRFSSEPIAP